MFLLFTLAWTKIKDSDKIEKHNTGLKLLIAVNAQLLDSN